MHNPLIIWLLLDGKPGHENQSLGLADAIGRRVPCEIHQMGLSGKRGGISRIRCARKAAMDLPKPDLIIAAGHATHLPLLWLGHQYRSMSVVLMKPSLPLSWFDLCIAPAHDFPNGCEQENVILTRGALNRVTTGTGEKTGKLILIGGPSKTHGWDGPALLDMLAKATDRGGWDLTDSRRTPDGFFGQLRGALPGVSAISHQETPPGWVGEKLQQAKEVWVTEDSVSMVYEAVSSGAKVGLLPMPRRKNDSRVLRGIDALVSDGYLTLHSKFSESGRLAAPPEPLREADRCAEMVCKRLTDNLSRNP